MAYGTLNAGTITPGSGNTLTVSEAVTFSGAVNLGTPSTGVVTNLSGVLPVGVTGGSGLTALGTVTAGNLSNTNIVYPVGHVIKTTQYTSTSSIATSSGTYVTIMTQAYTGTAGNLLMITSETKMSIRAGYYVWARATYDGAVCGSYAMYENAVNAHGTLLGPAVSMTGVVVCGSGAKNILIQADNTSSGPVTAGGDNRITVMEIQQ